MPRGRRSSTKGTTPSASQDTENKEVTDAPAVETKEKATEVEQPAQVEEVAKAEEPKTESKPENVEGETTEEVSDEKDSEDNKRKELSQEEDAITLKKLKTDETVVPEESKETVQAAN